MNRRDFLRLLGLAPLVPLAAKLKPFLPKEEARCDTFLGFRFVRTELLPYAGLGKLRKEYGFKREEPIIIDDREQGVLWKLPKNYLVSFDECLRETMRTQELKFSGTPAFSIAIGDANAPLPRDAILADFKA